MITFTSRGSFKNTERFLQRMSKFGIHSLVEKQAQAGVKALASATPTHTGLAADSWSYEVKTSGGSASIIWKNSDIESGFPVAIMLQYGYATGTGGYVQGRDYINPAIRPIFDKISETVWKAVTSA